MLQILDKIDKKYFPFLITIIPLIAQIITLLIIAFSLIFIDLQFFFMSFGYIIYVNFIFVIVNSIIYLIIKIIKKYIIVYYVMPVLFLYFSINSFSTMFENGDHTAILYFIAIASYILGYAMRKYSILIMMPIVYLFLSAVFYIFSLWEDLIHDIGAGIYSMFFIGGGILLLFYAISFIPMLILRYKYKIDFNYDNQ